MPTTKKSNKRTRNTKKITQTRLTPLMFAVLFAVVGTVAILITKAAPSTSAITLSINASDLHIGDFYTIQAKNLPKNLETKGLFVSGACYNNGKVVGNPLSEGIDFTTGVIQMKPLGGDISDMVFYDLPTDCVAVLKQPAKSGPKELAIISFKALGFRSKMTLNQTQPVPMDGKVSFSYSNLPQGVDPSNFKLNMYCDWPKGSEIVYGGGVALDPATGQSSLMPIVGEGSKWDHNGQIVSCHAVLLRYPVTASNGGQTSVNVASYTFTSKL